MIDWERLDRFVRGDGTRSERLALQHWVASDRVLLALAHEMSRIAGGAATQCRFDPAVAWTLHQRMRRKDCPCTDTSESS